MNPRMMLYISNWMQIANNFITFLNSEAIDSQRRKVGQNLVIDAQEAILIHCLKKNIKRMRVGRVRKLCKSFHSYYNLFFLWSCFLA